MKKEKKHSREEIEWIAILRSISIYSVVIIHSLGKFASSNFNSTNWWINNIYNSVAHYSVPVFVMISGFLLLDKNDSIYPFLKKRILKLFLPLLFWSIILFAGNIILKRPMSNPNIVISFIYDFFTNNINYVYWFVYMITGLYLINPILSKWIKNSDNKEIRFYIIIWFITLFINYFPNNKIAINIQYVTGYIGYYILGYYLKLREIENRKKNYISIILILLGCAITIFGNYYFRYSKLESYLTPNIAILSCGIFLFIKGKSIKSNKLLSKLTKVISKYSFGIYLTHIVFISILNRIGINGYFISPIIGCFIVSSISMISSIILLFLMNKIPLLKNINGAS